MGKILNLQPSCFVSIQKQRKHCFSFSGNKFLVFRSDDLYSIFLLLPAAGVPTANRAGRGRRPAGAPATETSAVWGAGQLEAPPTSGPTHSPHTALDRQEGLTVILVKIVLKYLTNPPPRGQR